MQGIIYRFASKYHFTYFEKCLSKNEKGWIYSCAVYLPNGIFHLTCTVGVVGLNSRLYSKKCTAQSSKRRDCHKPFGTRTTYWIRRMHADAVVAREKHSRILEDKWYIDASTSISLRAALNLVGMITPQTSTSLSPIQFRYFV